jgi:hypothetical protein
VSDHLQEVRDRIDGVIAKGRAEFPDFDARSEAVVELGGRDRPDFALALARIPDAHRAVAKLAEDPDEAVRILALPTAQMNLALVKLATKAAAKATDAKSPAPKPAATRTDLADPKLTPRQYIAARNEQLRARRQPPPAQPARAVNLYDPKLTARDFIAARNAADASRRGRR